jgi:hypothetical protein
MAVPLVITPFLSHNIGTPPEENANKAKIADLQNQISSLQESLRAANKKAVAQPNSPPAAPALAREPANYEAFSDWQKREFVDEIAKLKPVMQKVLILRAHSVYTQGFYRSWEDAFQRVGIPVYPEFQEPTGKEQVGVMMAVKDPSHPPYAVLQVIDAIKRIGYDPVPIVQLSDKNASLGYDFAIFLGLPPISP